MSVFNFESMTPITKGWSDDTKYQFKRIGISDLIVKLTEKFKCTMIAR